jgi:hypothetical protein
MRFIATRTLATIWNIPGFEYMDFVRQQQQVENVRQVLYRAIWMEITGEDSYNHGLVVSCPGDNDKLIRRAATEYMETDTLIDLPSGFTWNEEFEIAHTNTPKPALVR